MIKPSQHEQIKSDFIQFSGGFTPELAGEEVERYLRHHTIHVPGSSQEELKAFFDQWITDIDQGLQPSVG